MGYLLREGLFFGNVLNKIAKGILRNLQVIVDQEVPGYQQVVHATTGSSVRVEGKLLSSPAAGQKWELRATHAEIIGRADATYPLQGFSL